MVFFTTLSIIFASSFFVDKEDQTSTSGLGNSLQTSIFPLNIQINYHKLVISPPKFSHMSWIFMVFLKIFDGRCIAVFDLPQRIRNGSTTPPPPQEIVLMISLNLISLKIFVANMWPIFLGEGGLKCAPPVLSPKASKIIPRCRSCREVSGHAHHFLRGRAYGPASWGRCYKYIKMIQNVKMV